MGINLVVAGQGQLLQVVGALHAPRCLAGRLNGREQQSNQNPDDSDDHEQLHQRKRLARERSDMHGISSLDRKME